MKTQTKILIGVGLLAVIGIIIIRRNRNNSIKPQTAADNSKPKSFSDIKKSVTSRTSSISASTSQPVNTTQFQSISR